MPRANSVPIELNLVQRSRFWSKVSGYGSDGCWLWTGRTDDFGYGHFKIRYSSLKAHRVAWTLKRGPIPAGVTLDHLCRVPGCVNPAHLELVTNKENILRGESFAAKNAQLTHCKRGHPLTPENIRPRRANRHGRRECRLCEHARKHPQAGSTGTPSTRDSNVVPALPSAPPEPKEEKS